MAKTPLFPVDGTDIELYQVSKWNRRTIADGNWLNDNNIEPLMDNDIILAKAIAKSTVPETEIRSDGTISVELDNHSSPGKNIWILSVDDGKKKLAYLNANNGTSGSSQSWLMLNAPMTAQIPLPASSKILGNDYIEISNNKIIGLEPGKKYILSAELVASVDTALDHEYTVKVEAESAYSESSSQIEKHIFEFRIDGTKVHTVSKSITWMAQSSEDLRELRLFLTTTEDQGLPGVKFAIANIFCVEQGGSAGSMDGSGPVYWIGNNGPVNEEIGAIAPSKLELPGFPDVGGRSIRADSNGKDLLLDTGVYQVNAIVDVKLNEEGVHYTLDSLQVDFGEGYVTCNALYPYLGDNTKYSASFSFIKHSTADGTRFSITLKCNTTDGSSTSETPVPSTAIAMIRHLSVSKVTGGGGSGSSDPSEMQWFRGSSLQGNTINLPTSNNGTYAELVMANLTKNATNGGTLDVENGTVVLPDDKIYEWHALVEVANDGLTANTEADISVTATSDDGMDHTIKAKMPINEFNIIDLPLSGIARGSGNLQFKFSARLKYSDGESLSVEDCHFHFALQYLEVVAK